MKVHGAARKRDMCTIWGYGGMVGSYMHMHLEMLSDQLIDREIFWGPVREAQFGDWHLIGAGARMMEVVQLDSHQEHLQNCLTL